MLLSHRTSVKIRPEYSNIIGHMCYAASKLWMSATTNAIIIKNWDWKSILTGIIRKKHIKEICGTDSFRHRQRKRPVSSWIRRGDLFMSWKRPEGSKIQIRPVLNRTIYQSHTCRWGSGMRKVQTSCGCLCQRIWKAIWKKPTGSMKNFYILKIRFSKTWIT